MKKNIEVSLIIPAYNEEEVIQNSIYIVDNFMKKISKSYEILIVDDGSKDKTGIILKNIVKSGKFPNLRFVYYKDGRSRRENLAKSFKLLKGEYIILLDMDLSMDVEHLKEMIYWLDNGYDMVIPNRYHKKSKIKRHLKRYIISKIYNGVIRILFRTGLKDNICGFKAFKKDIALKLVEEAGIDKTRTRSVFWDTEILIRALRKGVLIKQIPIKWKEGKNSALTFRNEIKMLPYMLKFWLKR